MFKKIKCLVEEDLGLDKNSIVITLVTRKMLSYSGQWHISHQKHIRNTFKHLRYKSYWEPWHGQNSLFRHFQAFSATFSHVQAQWKTLRHTETSRHYCGIFSLFWTYSCLYNRAMFRTLAKLENKVSSKDCQPCKVIKHIQSPSMVRTVYSSILKNIQGY